MTALTAAPIWIDVSRPRPLCDVPWLGTSVILSNGNVNFCCFSSAFVGNVNTMPFEAIWDGPIMRSIRAALIDHRLPPECASPSCPFYRGDKLHYLNERVSGVWVEGAATPGSQSDIRSRLRPALSVSRSTAGARDSFPIGHGESISVKRGETLQVVLEMVPLEGKPVFADVLVAICPPDGPPAFLPAGCEYPLPFATDVCLGGTDSGAFTCKVFDRVFSTSTPGGRYTFCVALFEATADPNLLTNCYWSNTATFDVE